MVVKMHKVNKLRESATIILAAKSKANIYNYEVLSVKRNPKVATMAGSYVFPGGNTSDIDGNRKWLEIFEKSGYTTSAFEKLCPKKNIPNMFLDHTPNTLPKYMSLRICAIRETFEESGILICGKNANRNKENWATYSTHPKLFEWQEIVQENPEEFFNMCEELQVYPDLWALECWSHWITPRNLQVRYNTAFFISCFRETPKTRVGTNEISEIKYATPDESLLNDFKLFPNPQFYEFHRLRNFKNIEKLFRFSKERSINGCVQFLPYAIKTKEDFWYIYPGDDLYPNDVNGEKSDMLVMEHLPETKTKNRMLFNESEKKIIVENIVPEDGHLVPIIM